MMNVRTATDSTITAPTSYRQPLWVPLTATPDLGDVVMFDVVDVDDQDVVDFNIGDLITVRCEDGDEINGHVDSVDNDLETMLVEDATTGELHRVYADEVVSLKVRATLSDDNFEGDTDENWQHWYNAAIAVCAPEAC